MKKVFLKIRTELDQEQRNGQKGLDVLFSYKEDEGCINVMQYEDAVIQNVVAGKTDQWEWAYKQWKRAIQSVDLNYVSVLVMHILDELYRELDKNIVLSENYQKVNVYKEIRNMTEPEMVRVLGERFGAITAEIDQKKCTATENTIIKAKSYIDTHLEEDLGVEMLASYVFLNRSYFSREFKAYTGIGVMDYIIQKRMEKACELIKLKKYNAEKIAELVGYTDVKYFQRSFKKYTGYTIREYRNLNR